MAKSVSLHWYVELDNVDLSEFSRDVQYNSEHGRIDVSGFTATGADEFLAGNTVQDVNIEMFNSYASGEVFQTLYNLHKNRTVFDIEVRPNLNNPVSTTNPALRGSVQLLTFPQSATRGEVGVSTYTFTAADEDGLWWYFT